MNYDKRDKKYLASISLVKTKEIKKYLANIFLTKTQEVKIYLFTLQKQL